MSKEDEILILVGRKRDLIINKLEIFSNDLQIRQQLFEHIIQYGDLCKNYGIELQKRKKNED